MTTETLNIDDPLIDHPLSKSMRIGLTVSIVLHLLLLFLMSKAGASNEFSPESAVWVSIDPPSKSKAISESEVERRPPQIVSPPERTESERPPAQDPFLSDLDNSTSKQQIKRGDAKDAGSVIAPPNNHPASAPSKEREKSSENGSIAKQNLTKTERQVEKQREEPRERQSSVQDAKQKGSLKYLSLDKAGLNEALSKSAKDDPSEKIRQALTEGRVSNSDAATPYRPFSRPAGSGARFIGLRGSSDYLPNLPDGDITLLNTKANLYAVFVRRVATQVFSNLRASGWEALRASDISNLSDDATVSAILSPTGNLIDASLTSSSGSSRFDRLLLEATKNGAKDPNPPKAAAREDGNFHFIFKAKSWVNFTGDPRSGFPFERRWLLLATGLE